MAAEAGKRLARLTASRGDTSVHAVRTCAAHWLAVRLAAADGSTEAASSGSAHAASRSVSAGQAGRQAGRQGAGDALC